MRCKCNARKGPCEILFIAAVVTLGTGQHSSGPGFGGWNLAQTSAVTWQPLQESLILVVLVMKSDFSSLRCVVRISEFTSWNGKVDGE
jgi:hypothetical protein